MTQSLQAAMACFQPTLPLAVAFSGGPDSTALLLACAQKWPGHIVALHVNHGLQAAAHEFEQYCLEFCERWQIPLYCAKVDAHPRTGQSPEDAARTARYLALIGLLRQDNTCRNVQSIAVAQHADDQVETILLALSRGAGMAGLSAMPAHWMREGIAFHRPLLQVSGAAVRSWLHAQGEVGIQDPSNADQRFTRNRIRTQLMPALAQTFPQMHATFARSAAHAAQAQQLLNEFAAQDLQHLCHESDGLPQIHRLQTLSAARRANVLRYWLKKHYQVTPSTAQLQELQKQIQACTTRGHRIALKVGVGFVRRVGAVLAWYNR